MFIPIMINTLNYKLIIFGGGPVAYRRAKACLNLGMKITVVSPEIIEEFQDILGEIHYIQDVFQEKYIQKNSLILAATSSQEVNMNILECCRQREVLCNVSHSKDHCDFIFPATFKKGDILGSVSTQGHSPLLAKRIKEDIEDRISQELLDRMEEMGKIRDLLLKKCQDAPMRKKVLKDLLDLSLEELKDRRQEYENCHRIQGQ